MKRLFKFFVFSALVVGVSSCSAYLPEFENVEALDKGAHRMAVGGYGGAFVGVQQAGGAAFHSVGLSENTAWSTQGALGVQFSTDYAQFFETGAVHASFQTGPKFYLGNNWALSVPVGVLNGMFDGTVGQYVVSTPTLYKGINRTQNGLYMIYLRNEVYQEIGGVGPVYYPTLGFKYSFKDNPNFCSNLNLSIGGVFVGMTCDLR